MAAADKSMLENLAQDIAACRICRDTPDGMVLPHEPRPVAVLSEKARVQIIGQAPGTKVHESGRPFDDRSGQRLREWMGIDENKFYNRELLAITPMGFCFPGQDSKGGDLPPRKECAPVWHPKVMAAMPQVELVLLIGQYAQKRYLGDMAKPTLTETVSRWKEILDAKSHPKYLPLPHPSWRNNGWIRKNTWFSSGLLPELRKMIQLYM